MYTVSRIEYGHFNGVTVKRIHKFVEITGFNELVKVHNILQ